MEGREKVLGLGLEEDPSDDTLREVVEDKHHNNNNNETPILMTFCYCLYSTSALKTSIVMSSIKYL